MGINIIRAIFVLFCVFIGAVAYARFEGISGLSIIGAFVGVIVSAIGIFLEVELRKASIKHVSSAVLGGVLGMIIAYILSAFISALFNEGHTFLILIRAFLIGLLTYLGMIVGIKAGSEIKLPNFKGMSAPAAQGSNKILDTSVIIDGRIADLCDTGFMEGIFIIPRFILVELQHIADSSDSMKRARGRRGLDILHRMQKMSDIDVKVVDEDFPDIKDVDSKLIALGKGMKAKIITNDMNLNKIAELQGVNVLNINELCNALKTIVLPGETMKVFILKEGKESGQGVAYLDDGTMIVVDEARRHIGKNVEVVVTSVLQTTAGRMIFTKMKEDSEGEEIHQYIKG
ncbi:MAG: TRAM domain-containing protein [Nitrospirota bacterium]